MNKAAEPPSNAALSIPSFMQGYYSTALPILILTATLFSGATVGLSLYIALSSIVEVLI